MISKKLLAASILAAMGTSAHAIGFKAGDWNMDISGSVNAYYTSESCDNAGSGGDGALPVCGGSATGRDSTNIQNGLLPGFIIFSASTTQNGYDLKGVISIDPGTTFSGAGTPTSGQLVGDQRRVFLEFGNKSMGTFKLGRDIGLFGQNAILNDMSLLAVGGGSAFNGALNTTLGSIGAGYIYTEFQPQITYTAPAIGNLGLSIGAFQPKGRGELDSTGFQGLATYSLGETGKVWGAFIQQSRDQAPAAGGLAGQSDISGFELGGTVNLGALSLTGNYFTGEGLGTTLIGFGGADALGRERDSQGYLAQATYKVGNTKFGLNYGSSSLDANAGETARLLDETNQMVLGVYHNLTPSLTIAAEYINREQKFQRGVGASTDAESDTFAVGAILFF